MMSPYFVFCPCVCLLFSSLQPLPYKFSQYHNDNTFKPTRQYTNSKTIKTTKKLQCASRPPFENPKLNAPAPKPTKNRIFFPRFVVRGRTDGVVWPVWRGTRNDTTHLLPSKLWRPLAEDPLSGRHRFSHRNTIRWGCAPSRGRYIYSVYVCVCYLYIMGIMWVRRWVDPRADFSRCKAGCSVGRWDLESFVLDFVNNFRKKFFIRSRNNTIQWKRTDC